MTSLHETTLAEVEPLRDVITAGARRAADLAAASQAFARAFVDRFSTVALARVFTVAKLATLPGAERGVAEAFARSAGKPTPLSPDVPVLSLLGTAGVVPAWNDRAASAGHRAIPLIDKGLVEGAPMIAELLSALRIDLATLGGDAAGIIRAMTGGVNQRFFVPDARVAVDRRGRLVIGAREFVAAHGIRSVFGMGGAYVDGRIVVAIVFTTELLEASDVDRYPNLISTFKIETTGLAAAGAIFS